MAIRWGKGKRSQKPCQHRPRNADIASISPLCVSRSNRLTLCRSHDLIVFHFTCFCVSHMTHMCYAHKYATPTFHMCLSHDLYLSVYVLQYVVKADHAPSDPSQDNLLLSLKRGDSVEVLDNSINGKWFVRAHSGSGGVAHGWFPSNLLERADRGGVIGEEDVDGKKSWIQLTAGNPHQPQTPKSSSWSPTWGFSSFFSISPQNHGLVRAFHQNLAFFKNPQFS